MKMANIMKIIMISHAKINIYLQTFLNSKNMNFIMIDTKDTDYLFNEYIKNKFPVSIVLYGDIYIPYNKLEDPLGNFNLNIFQDISEGKEIYLPNFGMENIHIIHIDDVIQLITQMITYRNVCIGKIFYLSATNSMTFMDMQNICMNFLDIRQE